MKYDIQVNPFNPVEYLACCGILEILARFDANTVSQWEVEPQPRLWLESSIDEAALLQCVAKTLSQWSKWQTTAETTEEGEVETESDSDEEANEGLRLTPVFTLNGVDCELELDWWYETLNVQLRVETKGKSAWKMYTGQQTAETINRKMTAIAAQLLSKHPIASLTELLKLSAKMKGRFGFDPRSSRNALDTGFSANDLKQPVTTYLFAEMLAELAAQYFFPARTKQGGGITSARGWIKDDVFQYALWRTPLPITLARLAATGAAVKQDDLILLHAGRARRDKYANFKMAKTAAWPDKKTRKSK